MAQLHTRLARRLIRNFEYTHRLQLRFHLAMMTFWVLNLVAGTVLLFLSPNLWIRVGVYYVFVLSIYANWDTDYDAVSATQAAMHAQEAADAVTAAGSGGSATAAGRDKLDAADAP